MDTIQSMIRNRKGIVQSGSRRRFVSEEMRVKRQEHSRKIMGKSYTEKSVGSGTAYTQGYFRIHMYTRARVRQCCASHGVFA